MAMLNNQRVNVNKGTFTPVKGSNVNAGFKIYPSSIIDEQLKKLTITFGTPVPPNHQPRSLLSH